ncbi:MAG TPA: hypothetical protein DCR87_06975, partial [Acidobacteria bacterium]|nr:hypothetical protein [Acidobacteriota bacterium]
SWTDCTPALAKAEAPAQLWVSRVLASPHQPGTAFVAKSGFRTDDFKPYLFKTTDYGRTWTPISTGLTDSPVNVMIQDLRNADLLFAGTDNGLFISLDQGQSWQPFQNNMPGVKVTDLAIQPREADLVVGTYGRGIWITNIWPLQELNPQVLVGEAYLFSPRPAIQKQYPVFGNYHLTGDSHLFTPNEPDEVVIYYYLREEAKEKVKISFYDLERNLLAELSAQGKAGLNRVGWDMRKEGQGRPGPRVEPGYYLVVLEVAGQKLEQKALIRKRLSWSIGPQPVVLTTVDRQEKVN